MSHLPVLGLLVPHPGHPGPGGHLVWKLSEKTGTDVEYCHSFDGSNQHNLDFRAHKIDYYKLESDLGLKLWCYLDAFKCVIEARCVSW